MVEAPEASTTDPPPSINGGVAKATTPHQNHGSDSDAQEMLISSLRSQIQDLFSQVTQLNGKLVKSYDRVSDLEDDLHTTSNQARQSSLKISQLELERTQHLSALNTGLLVEKSQVTAELTRLMEKATEEAAQRGQAETAKENIEKDLDDLSATLFAQANTMVAEARYAQSTSERRVEQAETALKGAEEMVSVMQQQMQTLQAEKDEAEEKAHDMRVIMGKGKWVDRRSGSGADGLVKETRLLSSHLPYQEFLLFVAHLRSVHPSTTSPPAMTTLLTMPFLARLSSEDSEPAVRLDLAPSLNWLSRRSVLAAIHTGQLTIEPMSSSLLLSESSSTSSNIPGLNSSSNNISCALCGTPIFSVPELHHPRPPMHPSHNAGGANTNTNSWSASVIKKTLSITSPNGSPTPPPRSLSRPSSKALPTAPYPPQIHVFRIASPLPPAQPTVPPTRTASPSPFINSVGTSRVAAPPLPQNTTSARSNSLSALAQSPVYPLCTSGWCLGRLRATCTLWAFVRTGIVERVWEEEVPKLPQPPVGAGAGAPPPVPPRRRGLWSMASKLGERAASWSGDSAKEKKGEATAPPVQPVVSVSSRPTTPAPPLPKRSVGRNRTSTVSAGSTAPPPLPPRDALPPAVPEIPTPNPELAPAVPDLSKTDDATQNPPYVSIVPVSAPVVSPTAAALPQLPNPHPEPHAVNALKAEATAQKKKRLSAHQIPLPDSRPGTPRPATPVEGVATGATDATPAGLASGTPPPLPRRAAARAVRSALSSSGTSSRPESPTTALAAEADGDQTANVPAPDVVGKVEAAPDVAGTPTEETPTNSDLPAVAEASGDGSESHEQAKVDESAPVADVDVPVAQEPGKDDVATANGRVDTDVEEEAKGDEDHEVYIGDVTWEERTWKEVVRLREDMFWARIGGIRS
ncbi:proline-rich protein [Mycena pura]|uniref:Proline-rich protein n=1 Tax=Mycena pura TaxID=153505 RepID=A0AAD6UW65_9AGAR|nr:proline-rich protein [Mycena pura]